MRSTSEKEKLTVELEELMIKARALLDGLRETLEETTAAEAEEIFSRYMTTGNLPETGKNIELTGGKRQ